MLTDVLLAFVIGAMPGVFWSIGYFQGSSATRNYYYGCRKSERTDRRTQ